MESLITTHKPPLSRQFFTSTMRKSFFLQTFCRFGLSPLALIKQVFTHWKNFLQTMSGPQNLLFFIWHIISAFFSFSFFSYCNIKQTSKQKKNKIKFFFFLVIKSNSSWFPICATFGKSKLVSLAIVIIHPSSC